MSPWRNEYVVCGMLCSNVNISLLYVAATNPMEVGKHLSHDHAYFNTLSH